MFYVVKTSPYPHTMPMLLMTYMSASIRAHTLGDYAHYNVCHDQHLEHTDHLLTRISILIYKIMFHVSCSLIYIEMRFVHSFATGCPADSHCFSLPTKHTTFQYASIEDYSLFSMSWTKVHTSQIKEEFNVFSHSQ